MTKQPELGLSPCRIFIRIRFFFGIFGLENLALKTFRRNMDNLIFYLAKMALVLAYLATTPTRGRKEDENLKMCF